MAQYVKSHARDPGHPGHTLCGQQSSSVYIARAATGKPTCGSCYRVAWARSAEGRSHDRRSWSRWGSLT